MRFVVLLIVGRWLTLWAISLMLTLRFLVILCMAALFGMVGAAVRWRAARGGSRVAPYGSRVAR